MKRHDKYVKEKCRVYGVPITVKCLRFYLTWNLTIWPASFMDADRRYKNPRSKTKKYLLTVIVIAEDLAFFFFHQFPMSQVLQSNVKTSAHKVGCSSVQVSQALGIQIFCSGSEHATPLPGRRYHLCLKTANKSLCFSARYFP